MRPTHLEQNSTPLGGVVTTVPRDVTTTVTALRTALAQVGASVRAAHDPSRGHALEFTLPDHPAVTWLAEVERGPDGTVLGVALFSAQGCAPERAQTKAAKQVASAVLGATLDALGGAEKLRDEQMEQLRAATGADQHQFLAHLTGRRAWLAALVLGLAYLLPLGFVAGTALAWENGLLGSGTGVTRTIMGIGGFGLFLAATIRVGFWAQAVSFGEEYPLTFTPLPGFLLGSWRFVLQLCCLALLVVRVAEFEDPDRFNDAGTEALPQYATTVPIPESWQLMDTSTRHSEYEAVPNATYETTYQVPAQYSIADLEQWLRSSDWSAPSSGPSFGALEQIECDTQYETCHADVTPAPGEPITHTLTVRLWEPDWAEATTREIDLEVEYTAATPH